MTEEHLETFNTLYSIGMSYHILPKRVQLHT